MKRRRRDLMSVVYMLFAFFLILITSRNVSLDVLPINYFRITNT